MRHNPRGGHGRHPHSPDGESGHHHHRHHHRGHHRHHRGGRLFDYGELRLLLLAMIVERPRHGYELIKAIEDRFSGSYSPSPGVIYPTLSWLEDMGYAAVEDSDGNRKRYAITTEGESFLSANRAAADDLLSRAGAADGGGPASPPAPLLRAMENLKLALRLRLKRGPLDQATTELIAGAIDAAAQSVERS
jgi:DNA-binding PadR family transcriptional regulator